MLRGLHALLSWLDASPARYWAFAWITLGLVAASAVLAFAQTLTTRRPGVVTHAPVARWNRPAVFVALLALAIFAGRWPLLFDNQQLPNPDESHMISGAITLQSDLVFWRNVDGTTHGPLVAWPLSLAGRAGMRLDFTNARLFSAGLMLVMLVTTWLTLRQVFGDGLARLLVLPAATLQATTIFWDFAAYTSEHVPLAVLATATWLLATQLFPAVRCDRRWRYGLAGLLLGAVPFAKLQGTPIGLWLGGVALVCVLRAGPQPWRDRLRAAAWLVGGALVVPAAMFTMILVHDMWDDFWIAYIVINLSYAGERWFSWAQSPVWLHRIADNSENFVWFLHPLLALTVVGAALAWRTSRDTERRFAGFCGGLLLAALYATLAPGRAFQHYLQFLIAPLTLAAGAMWGPLLRAREARSGLPARHPRAFAAAVALVFLAVSVGGQVHARTTVPIALGGYTTHVGRLQRRAASVLLRQIAQPGDRLGLWGWMPVFFVETGLRQATREAHTYRQIVGGPMLDYYRARYLDDFRRANPALFIDTVGGDNFTFKNRATEAHEIFPEFARHIAENYVQVADLDGSRIYVRRDRAAQLPPAT